MQCRASNPLARRIKGWSPKTCLGRPARKTRRTEVRGVRGKTPTSNLEGRLKIKMHCARM